MQDPRKAAKGVVADYSFNRLTDLNLDNFFKTVGIEGIRTTRVLGSPKKSETEKYITRSVWLNNNKLKTIEGLDGLIENILEYPSQLKWLDLSFNYLKTIDEVLLKFPNLTILYLHGNCISELDEIFKLRNLKELRSVTFQGNPISNSPKYRSYIVSSLPQAMKIDFTPILKTDKMMPLLPEVLKKIEGLKKVPKKSDK